MEAALKWFAEYKCGCVSDYHKRKKDVLDYCGKHGDDVRYYHKVPILPDGMRYWKDEMWYDSSGAIVLCKCKGSGLALDPTGEYFIDDVCFDCHGDAQYYPDWIVNLAKEIENA